MKDYQFCLLSKIPNASPHTGIKSVLNYAGEYCNACQVAVTVIMSGDAALSPTCDS